MYILMYMKRRARHSIADVRRNLASVVRSVEKGAVVELTRRGEPVAVLLSARDYEGLAGRAGDLWEAIRGFRRTADLEQLGIEDLYRDVRDRSPGRRVRV
jgi:prevent-host-death family protein